MIEGSLVSTARPEGVRLHVRGELDGAAVERLRALLADDVAVRVDLSRAGVLPVGALRALAAAHSRGQQVALEHPSAAARRALRVSGLDRVLAVVPTGVRTATAAGPAAAAGTRVVPAGAEVLAAGA